MRKVERNKINEIGNNRTNKNGLFLNLIDSNSYSLTIINSD